MAIRALIFAAIVSVFSAHSAAAWVDDDIDAQVEKTNVEVGGVCSGTIISVKERLILTAHHCIDQQLIETEEKIVDPKTGEIQVKRVQKRIPLTIKIKKIYDYDIIASQEFLVKIVGDDPSNDIALLQVTDPLFVPEAEVKLADDYPLKRGMTVYAVGNPGIEFGDSITEGIISAPERTVDFGPNQKFKMFQHSAGVIGGNSGGSVLNEDGELIGTVTGGVRGAPISFAIPVRYSKDLIKKAGFERILK